VDEDPSWLDVCITNTWINWIMDDHGWSWMIMDLKHQCPVFLWAERKTKLHRGAGICLERSSGTSSSVWLWGNDVSWKGKDLGWAILCKGNFCQPIPPKLVHENFVSLHLFRWEWWYIYPRYRIY
jgi:hypothetical protein